MGGYGASSGRIKGKCYYDTGGHKVTDKNAIAVAEKYIEDGKYVAFLQEKDGQPRADLSVDGVHVEVKGLTTLSPNTVCDKLEHAFKQIHGDDNRYPKETHREGKVVIYSRHSNEHSENTILEAMKAGYQEAKRKGYISGKLEVWIRGKIHKLN